MNNELPKDIGGYQHIEYGVTQSGDIWVCNGIPSGFVMTLGVDVKELEHQNLVAHIYRKIAVPKNNDDKKDEYPVVGEEGFIHKLSPPLFRYDAPSFIPQDDKSRKNAPMHRGLLGYFPAALFHVATHSMESDLKHNPGSVDGPTWARGKSSDHADCIVRHLVDAGTIGTPDRLYHLRALAWRALAMLQEEAERGGALPGISSR